MVVVKVVVDAQVSSNALMPKGPLSGIRVIELGNMGPVPFAGMFLADLGADVIRVERPASTGGFHSDSNVAINRGRRSIILDLKHSAGRVAFDKLLDTADVLMDGYRPGVCERLGLDQCRLERDFPQLVFARMSSWGQDGPRSLEPAHDINVLAVSGILATIGTDSSGPVPPPMYISDFAGGGLVLAGGVLSALLERHTSGRGQVIDSSMLEGTSLLTVVVRSLLNRGDWVSNIGMNAYDTGSHFYSVYETRDEKFIAVGAVEPEFYRNFVGVMGLDGALVGDQFDRRLWPEYKSIVAELFLTDTRDAWVSKFDDADACVTPVLTLEEADLDSQSVYRKGVINGGAYGSQPAPTPRFSRTPNPVPSVPPERGAHTREVLESIGVGHLL